MGIHTHGKRREEKAQWIRLVIKEACEHIIYPESKQTGLVSTLGPDGK